jgi:FAD/FMN-containing dehydrogenase
MTLKDKLKPIVRGELYDDAARLDDASRDASLFELKPELVIAPKDAKDIGAIVRFLADERKAGNKKVSITPRSAGTDMSGGPLTESLVLDMKPHFNRILEIGEDYVVTEPGVFYRDLEKQTLKKNGRIVPSYPASRELCTIGGMVANNGAGEKTLTYGKTGDWVRELHVVFADGNEYLVKPLTKHELDKKMAQGDFEGNLYKQLFELIEKDYDAIKKAKPTVSKNSAGYYLWNVWDRETGIFDLCKMISGSQGTLGIITRIKIGLVKPKKHGRMLVVFLKDISNLGDLVNEILSFKPETFESYDDHTLKLAVRFMPQMVKKMAGKGLISLGISFIPEVLAVMKLGGLPKLILMAEFTGDNLEEVQAQAQTAYEGIKHFGYNSLVTHSAGQDEKYWTVRRESFTLLRQHIKGVHTAPFIDDTVVHPSDLPKFLPELNAIMGQYDLTYTVAGHIGDANFHIIPLMDLKDPKTKEIIPKLSREVYDLVIRYHGSITGEHNDGMIRTPYLLDMYGHKIYNLFVKTKLIFDPYEFFNPGKKVHGNLKKALEHFVDDNHLLADDRSGKWQEAEESR